VIALGEHLSGTPEGPVHRAREPGRERLHPAPARILVVGLDEEVRVIVLDRVVHEPEVPRFTRIAERSLELAHEAEVA
jgi:hypothetical protein